MKVFNSLDKLFKSLAEHEHDTTPVMIIYPDEETARKANVDRIQPMIKKSDPKTVHNIKVPK